MPSVVVNSTPIISLHHLGKLDLLEKMYHRVYIPYAVYEEVSVEGSYKITKEILFSFSNFTVERVQNTEAKKYFKTALHEGEVEAMILTTELDADLCVLDDQLARSYAKLLGLTITGTLGILLKAKENKLLDKVMPLVDTLIEKEIYISTNLYRQIKVISGE